VKSTPKEILERILASDFQAFCKANFKEWKLKGKPVPFETMMSFQKVNAFLLSLFFS